QLHPGCCLSQGHKISAPLNTECLYRPIDPRAVGSCSVINPQAGCWSVRIRRRQTHAQCAGRCVELKAFEGAGIKREPCSCWSQIDTHAEGIERRDSDCRPGNFDIAAKDQPAEFAMMDNIGS